VFVGSGGGGFGVLVGGGTVGDGVWVGVLVAVSVGVAVDFVSVVGVLVGVGDSLVFDGVAVEVDFASSSVEEVGLGVLVGVIIALEVAVGVLEELSFVLVAVALFPPESSGSSTSVFDREDNGVANPAGLVIVGTGTGVVGSLPGVTVVPWPAVKTIVLPWPSTSTVPSMTATSVTPAESTSTVNSVPRTFIVAAGV
jgi:hypothetical protein